MEIIEQVEKGVKQNYLAEKYGCARSTISTIFANRATLREEMQLQSQEEETKGNW